MLCTRCLRAVVVQRQVSTVRWSSNSSWLPPAASRSSALGKLGDSPLAPGIARSICPAGTVLTGLNYKKGGSDPVAMKDEEYPSWLWSCLKVKEKKSIGLLDDSDADEFSKSKKERRLAAKQQKAREAKLLASGDLEALAPKIPLQQQSINLPGKEGGSVIENIQAMGAREQLKLAMRQERKARIKEANYLKTM